MSNKLTKGFKMKRFLTATCAICTTLALAAPTIAKDALVPAKAFDLSEWNITLPIDKDKNGKPDQVTVKKLKKYSHPDFFYLNEDGGMVFAAPNKAATTKNSSNTRSELRHMLRGKNTSHKTHGYKNNFAVEARTGSNKFGRIGGRLDATLKVDHVAKRAGDSSTKAAYSVVVGQIHAVKYDNTTSGFGYGNEPIKIYYKKFPDHEYGSVFWTYERNLAKNDDNRTDIAYPVFGNTWKEQADPSLDGIKLGEEFSYTINVHRNVMYLTFTSPRHGTKTYKKSLVQNIDPYGQIDPLDNKFSYGGDSLYFKAGAYNQCSTKKGGGTWYAGCAGTGDWAEDKANGDYVQATFSKLTVGESTPPN